MAASQLSSTKAKATTAQHTVTSERSSLPETIGKRVDPDYSKTLHNKVKSIFGIHHDGFPGSQPVTFDAKHLRDLEREDYFVCEKNDGERYLLFFVHSPKGPAAFLFDRNRIWYYVPNLVFPLRGREKEYLKDTLMDGELVMDKDNDQTSWRFLVFDLMAINAVPVTQRSFNTRLGMAQQEVIQPFNASLRHVPRPPFTIELKKMERSYGLHLVFDQVAKSKHESDGVIFTPVKHPYVSGTCEKLLKWKPPEHHTVDFRISARWSKEHKPIYSLEVLSHGVTYKFYDQFQPEPALASQWKSHLPDGRIAEFRYDPNWEMTIIEQGYAPTTRKGGWRFVRFRDDKGAANDESMVKNTMRSIRNGVSKEQLLAHMDKVRTAWKAREKGLPMPSFSSSTTSKSTDTLSLSTSTNSNHQSAISPSSASILPSPSVVQLI
ncbi:mRNA capping enzyme, catalytic domain-containing protein [Radiomyces spectabilis]|uniref:mRNA capping enzyme, catalytic domain-containing protein n=1 Tax=Radiomyces spectabilis TaxID=64574 RepID=UPI00221FF932|nr:mRNA capping enzyme, catalytic domain-containing protein [Radiomyces spectabilis]KAI8376276.1 mRNA capping enzyme, catalytic domain-containing protein [Radiomyces spectabilis]